jgi:hypothetical protein
MDNMYKGNLFSKSLGRLLLVCLRTNLAPKREESYFELLQRQRTKPKKQQQWMHFSRSGQRRAFQFSAQFKEMDPVSKFCFANRILPQSARFSQYPQSPIKPGYIEVTEEALMEVLMADREIEAFLCELFELEDCRTLHTELRRISKVEKGSLICRLLLPQSASNMKHGYVATAGPLDSAKRHLLVGTMVTNGTDLKLSAIDTSRNKKDKQKIQFTGPNDEGIGKYLDDVEKVILDEGFHKKEARTFGTRLGLWTSCNSFVCCP